MADGTGEGRGQSPFQILAYMLTLFQLEQIILLTQIKVSKSRKQFMVSSILPKK